MNFDFHSHTNHSDGILSPTELVDRASQRAIELLAITDHDSTSALSIAAKYISDNQLSVRLVNGVEISALTEYGEIHIVGLNIDWTDGRLIEALESQRQKRWVRAEKICEELAVLGLPGVLDEARIEVVEVITRCHLARAMVRLGQVKDQQQAFKKYLGRGAPIKPDKDWLPMAKAISLIRQAGGVAVLAHPTRYPFSNRRIAHLINQFAEAGGNAIETAYPSLSKDKIQWLESQRKVNNLLSSSGSDFHYPNLKWSDLGKFPPISTEIPQVYQQLEKIML